MNEVVSTAAGDPVAGLQVTLGRVIILRGYYKNLDAAFAQLLDRAA